MTDLRQRCREFIKLHDDLEHEDFCVRLAQDMMAAGLEAAREQFMFFNGRPPEFNEWCRQQAQAVREGKP